MLNCTELLHASNSDNTFTLSENFTKAKAQKKKIINIGIISLHFFYFLKKKKKLHFFFLKKYLVIQVIATLDFFFFKIKFFFPVSIALLIPIHAFLKGITIK